jgi:RsiW-degrading membrane proteinase PrsW (M82 family)
MTEIPPTISSQPLSMSETAGSSRAIVSHLDVLKNRLLILLAITAFASVLIFYFRHSPFAIDAIAAYILFSVFYVAWIYSRISTNIVIYAVPFLIVYLELTTPILRPLIYVFRTILPGNPPSDPAFFNTFATMFLGAGLMEEFMKAVPALIGMSLALRSPKLGNVSSFRYLDSFRCSTPLEGIMLSLAAGAAFAYVESVYSFVPETAQYVPSGAVLRGGFINELGILLPGVFRGITGHMCWAGIAGYFIGRAARYPASIIKLLAIAWLLPATLHAFWNASPYLGEIGRWVRIGVSLPVFLYLFVTAKRETARGE